MTQEGNQQQTEPAASGLNKALLTVLFFAMLLPAVLVGGILIKQKYQSTVEQDSVGVAQHYGNVLESGMVMPLWNLSPGMGMPVIESVSADTSVISVQVFLQSGETFLEFQRLEDSREETESIEIERPVIFDNNQLGKIQLVYSLEKVVEQSLDEAVLLVKVIGVQMLFVLVLMFWILRSRVALPLKNMIRAVDKLVSGDLGHPVERFGGAEFERLSKRLEAMRIAVNNEVTLLERRVEERTKELSTLNATLKNTLEQLHHTYDQLVQADKMAALGNILTDINKELVDPIRAGCLQSRKTLERHQVFNAISHKDLNELTLKQYGQEMGAELEQLCLQLEKAYSLISDVEQVTVESVSNDRRQFSLLRLLNETCTIMAPAIKRTPYRVLVDMDEASDVTMESYPHALGQVVQNVIGNALLHAFETRTSGDVVIRAVRNDQQMAISITDNGVGIQPKQLECVFERFFTTRKHFGGMGLGLHIVKVIVESVLGGQVAMQSVVNEGTTVNIVIPVVAPVTKSGEAEENIHRSA